MVSIRWSGLLAAFVLGALVAGSASAQQGRRGQMFLGQMLGDAALLRSPAVQAELKLTDEQKTKAQELVRKLATDLQGMREKFQSSDRQEIMKAIAEIQVKANKEVSAILNADQAKRLRQITLQQQGLMALQQRKDAADELKLTSDQRSKIAEIVQQQQAAIQAAFQGGGAADAGQKIQALRKEADDKISALLTDEQKNQWKGMLGAPFQFPGRPGAAGGNAGR